MEGLAKRLAPRELKSLVVEASRALERLDAARLEELALCCVALNRELMPLSSADRAVIVGDARETAREMAILARVLEATRGNLRVMRRLRELRMGQLEYEARLDAQPARPHWFAEPAGSGDGHD